MKKILLVFIAMMLCAPAMTSCREENDRDVEVQNLKPDAEDSTDDETFDTNPVPSEEDPYEVAGDTTNSQGTTPSDTSDVKNSSTKGSSAK